MKILVTGGAGYIGSHACAILQRNGYDVIAIDNLSKGHEDAVTCPLYIGDLRDTEFVEKVFESNKIDGVMHFAADSLVGESMENPLKYYDNNMGGAISLLKTMKKYDVKNIVFSSTAATYGIPETVPIKEDDTKNPINTYGETKLAIEKMLKWCEQAYGIKYVCLRYFNVAGALSDGSIGERHNPETHLIPIVLQAAAGVRPIMKVFGNDYNTPDGTCVRDYIHVEDLIDAHIKAMTYLFNGGKSDAFNLGNGSGFSNLQIIEAARKVSGSPIPTEIAERRPGDPDVLIASSDKAREILGWVPKKQDIETIIADAWNFYTKQLNK